MKILFKDRNNIIFGQDFSMKQGLPSDRVFTSKSTLFQKDTDLWLNSFGYGEYGNYGNGAIVISKEELSSKNDQWQKIEE